MSLEKLNEIKKLLKQGMPEGEIRQNLKEQGYSNEEIEEAFKPHKYDIEAGIYFLQFYLPCMAFGCS